MVAPDRTLPIGTWFKITVRVLQSHDFDGAVRVWLDDRLLFDVSDVRTGMRNCAYNDWCVDQGWSVNSYSDGLTPQPAVIYVDDLSVRWPQGAAPGVSGG